MNRWLLPEGIEEVLPQQARRIEQLRRRILDLYDSWGYDLVMPPFIEYLESLLTGTGNDLDLQTFKLTDQLTGRLMGIRADMTPQVARIDAHQLKHDTPTRLCYMGTVLHTRPDGFAGSRSPLQIGAELYGHAGAESDVEVISLMIATLSLTGIVSPYIDLGHVGIYRQLVTEAGLHAEQESILFDALQRKAVPEIKQYVKDWNVQAKLAPALLALADLHGDDSVLSEAEKLIANSCAGAKSALDELLKISSLLKQRVPGIELHYDLAELRGYHYHTGLVFAAFVPGQGQAIAQGGRYDDIGKDFGRARPATGFSTDLKTLISLNNSADASVTAIFAPSDDDGALRDEITKLRQQGERVIVALPGQLGDAAAMGCDRQLVKSGAAWQVQNL